MTVDESATAAQPAPGDPDDEFEPEPPRTTQQQAVDAYLGGLRIWRRLYTALIVAAVIAAVVIVRVAWQHGEIAHTTLKTFAAPPAAAMLQGPGATVTKTWQSADSTAIGTPFAGGTVVTWSPHTMRGRNAETGAVTWSYTRTDRLLCQAIQVQGVAIAFYELHGDCDEVTALDAQTGKRKWTRTFDKDNTGEDGKGVQRIVGHPSYAVSDFTVLVYSQDVIYAFEPTGGLDRWVFGHAGCTIHDAILGSQGALISQTCQNEDCTGVQSCFDGDQLLLRNGNDARDDSRGSADKPANTDKIIWNLRYNTDVPVSADQVISSTNPTATELTIHDPAKGATISKLALHGSSSTAGVEQVATAQSELIWIGGVTYSIELTGAKFFWSRGTTGPPTATSRPGSSTTPVDLDASIVLVPLSDGVASLVGRTGAVQQHYSFGAPQPGSSAFPYGTGFVVAGQSTTTYR